MLTREVEGSTIKCGNYWSDEKFGPLRLKLLEVTGAMDEYEKSDRRVPGDPFFPYVSKTPMAHPETGSGNGESSSPRRPSSEYLSSLTLAFHTFHPDGSSSSSTLIGPTLTFRAIRAAYLNSSERLSTRLGVARRPENHGRALVGLMTGMVAL